MHKLFVRRLALILGLTLLPHFSHSENDPHLNSRSLVLTEVLTRNLSFPNPTTRDTQDWVELENQSDVPLPLNGFALTDDPSHPDRWSFPTNVTVPPHQRIVVDLNADLIVTLLTSRERQQWTAPFSLSSSGDEVYLFQKSPAEGRFELVDAIRFGPQIPNYSLGRSADGDSWTLCQPTPGAPNQPTSLGDLSLLTINEWMASPSEGSDWIELHNAGTLPVSLDDISISDREEIQPKPTFGRYSYIGTENHGFALAWADEVDAPGHVAFKLSASGESLKLFDGKGAVIDSVTFETQLPGRSEGRMPDGGSAFRKLDREGTAGLPNAVPIEGLQFSEILSHTDDPLEDAIEIQNLRAESIDLGGWYLSDNPTAPRKYRIPDGTVIDPGGFAVFYRYQFQPRPGIFPSFGFNSAHGDDLYLFSFQQDDTDAVGRIKAVFASAPNGYSFGTHLTSIGFQLDLMSAVSLGTSITATNPVDQTPLFRLGRGATNPPVLMTPLALSEIGAGLGSGFDFVEIRSLVSTNVTFYDLVFPSNTYTLRGAIHYSWPTNTQIKPGESVVVVGFDPALEPLKLQKFQQRFFLGAEVQVFGPYEGSLKQSGGEIKLYRPDIPQFCFDPDFGFVAPILVDRVRYRDECPWPEADHNWSIQRTNFESLGDDPVYWRTGPPSPGSDSKVFSGEPPQVIPAGPLTAKAGEKIAFSVSPSKGGEDRSWCIQWRFNGELLPQQEQSSLLVGPLTPKHSGTYTALVRNTFGASRVDFPFSVIAAPAITKAPESTQSPKGGQALLRICAEGAPPFRYVWHHDGMEMPGQTNATLLLTQLSERDTGFYSVTLITAAGSITSSPAEVRLLANEPPRVIAEPKGLDFREISPIPKGSAFSLSVLASGEPPLKYQWFKDGSPIVGAEGSTFEFPRFSNEDAGAYHVEIQNAYGVTQSKRVALQTLIMPAVQIDRPEEIVVDAGEDVPLPTISEGTPRLYYQWMWNDKDIPAELCKDFTRFSIQHHEGGLYQVRVWNKQGEVVLGRGISQKVRIIVRPRIAGLTDQGDAARVEFRGTEGEHYLIQGSTDLKQWDDLTEVVAKAGLTAVSIPKSSSPSESNARWFYRIVRD